MRCWPSWRAKRESSRSGEVRGDWWWLLIRFCLASSYWYNPEIIRSGKSVSGGETGERNFSKRGPIPESRPQTVTLNISTVVSYELNLYFCSIWNHYFILYTSNIFSQTKYIFVYFLKLSSFSYICIFHTHEKYLSIYLFM